MVVAAQGDGVGQVGASAVAPGVQVVGLGPRERDVAPVCGARVVGEGEGGALGGGEEPVLAAQVDRLGVPAEDGGDDPGAAGGPAGLAGGEGVPGRGGGDDGVGSGAGAVVGDVGVPAGVKTYIGAL